MDYVRDEIPKQSKNRKKCARTNKQIERKLELDIDERICNIKTLAKNNLTFRRE